MSGTEPRAGRQPVGRVLHILSQRPSLTGSGVTLDAIVRQAEAAGWNQRVVVGVPAADPRPEVGGLAPERLDPLVFDSGELNFPLPGMSDVMPYRSSVFAQLTTAQLAAYRDAWRRHLVRVAAAFRPEIIHAHHVWIVASLLKDILPAVPVVNHCHATGLRQMQLCLHLAAEVKQGARRNERFLVLSHEHARQLAACLQVPAERIHIVGAGYRADLFHTGDAVSDAQASAQIEELADTSVQELVDSGADSAGFARSHNLLFIGKYSAAKGLPWLLDAFARLQAQSPQLRLHVAGTGAGEEADALHRRMSAMAPSVVLHGQVAQPELARLMRRCAVCVLPSFYEGVPLVLVEALACGCRLVATRLPGVEEQLAPALGTFLDLVPMPRLTGVDTPVAEDLPTFVDDLARALAVALARPAITTRDPGWDSAPSRTDTLHRAVAPFTWASVFSRVEAVWKELLA